MKKIKNTLKKLMLTLSTLMFFCMQVAFAAPTTQNKDLGWVASNVTGTMQNLGLLVTAVAYVAGLGFAMASIFKFMHYKNNPQQETIGKPITMLFVAAGLLFMPSVFSATGTSLFGPGFVQGSTSGLTVIPTTPNTPTANP